MFEQSFLKQILEYDPLTGELRWKSRDRAMFSDEKSWKQWNARNSGKVAFTSQTDKGYFRGQIMGVKLFAHVVIWKLVTGEDSDRIDHQNGVTSDNRFSNLRSVNATVNNMNKRRSRRNKTGATGVSFHKRSGKYQVHLTIAGHQKYLGCYETIEEASRIYENEKLRAGYSLRHGTI